MANFGPGDNAPNDFVFSGANTFWTNWGTTTVASGGLGRVASLNCRWGTNASSTTGHHDLWGSGNALAVTCVDFSNSSSGTGVYAQGNTASPSPTWIANDNYFGGFSRTASQTSTVPFKDGTGGNYAGKSAGDATNSGGTTNWGGVGSPGGVGWLANFTVTILYVRRAGAWVQVPTYVRRAGAWVRTQVSVRRSAAWTTVAFHDLLNRTEEHIPESGMRVEVNVDREGWEPGWIIEKDEAWFGTEHVASTGRFGSEESAEIVEQRLQIYHEWDIALNWENYEEANRLQKVLWPMDNTGKPRLEMFPGYRKEQSKIWVPYSVRS